MKYQYSTKPDGIDYVATATAIHKGSNITIKQEVKASCEKEAADYFEEYLQDNHEGFDFTIQIVKKSDAMYSGNSVVSAT